MSAGSASDPSAEVFDLDGGAGRPRDVPQDVAEDEQRGRRPGWRERLVRWPRAVPAWSRGPAAVLAAVLLTAAGAGSLATASAAARVDQQVAARTALLGLTASTPVLQGLGAPSPQGGSPAAASMVLTLGNRAEEDLQVQVTGISPPASLGAEGVERVTVPAEDARVVTLPLQVDCTAAVEVSDDGTATAGAQDRPRPWVDVRVTSPALDLAGGGATRLPLPDERGGFTTQVALLCDPAAFYGTIGEPLGVRDDGALLVRLVNERNQAVELVTSSAPGVGLVLDPPLEGGLPEGASAEVALVLDVDCDQAGDLLALPYELSLVSVVGEREFPVLDPPVLSAWAASRVTAACG